MKTISPPQSSSLSPCKTVKPPPAIQQIYPIYPFNQINQQVFQLNCSTINSERFLKLQKIHETKNNWNHAHLHNN